MQKFLLNRKCLNNISKIFVFENPDLVYNTIKAYSGLQYMRAHAI